MQRIDALFRPFRLKTLELPNRIVMAPMTRWMSPNQIPDDNVADYYRRRAEGGVGLIITEGTSPDHKAASDHHSVPAFFGDEALAGWKKVVAGVKAAGGCIVPQLWHMGAQRANGAGPYPEARSLAPSGFTLPEQAERAPMSKAEIEDVVAGYARSAAHARALGFDGVEIHAAHGYLIDQFFWAETNRRQDEYGGAPAERARFAAEIVRAMRAVVGPQFPIILRLSQWKLQNYGARIAQNPHELEAYLSPLVDAGVDMFHCSTRRFWEAEFPETGSALNLAGWTKKLTGVPTIAVGSIALQADDKKTAYRARDAAIATDRFDTLFSMLERDEFDLAAIGRALLANPALPRILREGRYADLKPYTPAVLDELH